MVVELVKMWSEDVFVRFGKMIVAYKIQRCFLYAIKPYGPYCPYFFTGYGSYVTREAEVVCSKGASQ